ncbi:helix-turn-helix domain-containing protein [Pumilibacter muris]|uniref:helix-turn-helix domain-containing protein n=1 Tax=Pumilibacter muris TaxID=2941510 RepID=UPI00203CB558|nr:helix-turn-helix transcriptional regulator [Pumilibacter muris]
MKKPTIVAQRLKGLRESVRLSQAKLAANFEGVEQPAIFRYEKGQAFPPYGVLMQYADFFDVSLDYIFGRTDNPQGKLYDFQPKVWKNQTQMQELIEMCFDPNSPANAQLKETLLRLMGEQNK